jgi:selenocysteine lyase/cysteine desulfurase
MTHRREFLKRATGMLSAAAAAPLLDAHFALARSIDGVSEAVGAHGLGAGADGPDGATLDRLDSADLDRFAARIREGYLLGSDVVYLNHASIGTIPRVVHEAHKAYLAVCESNPWLYMWGGVWEEPREAVRAKGAVTLGVPSADVAITHNTTEGFNLLAQGLPLGPGDEVLFSSLNHDGASVCFHHHAEARRYAVRQFDIPIESVPGLSAADLIQLHADQIRPETRLLAFPHVDNIVGLRHPMAELARAAHERGVEFVAVDGAQTVGMLPIEAEASGVDFYAASPHKWVQSPKGLGLLYARPEKRTELRAMWVTWGQTRWEGSARIYEDYGTRNLPALLALGDALDFQTAIGSTAKSARYRHFFERLWERTEAAPGLSWSSPERWEMGACLVAISIEGLPSTEFSRRMLEHGFVFRPFRTQGLNSVRISPNLMTSEEELAAFFETAEQVLAEP